MWNRPAHVRAIDLPHWKTQKIVKMFTEYIKTYVFLASSLL